MVQNAFNLLTDTNLHLTEHFTFREMFRTDQKVSNCPPTYTKFVAVLHNLKRVCNLLEMLRLLYGKPILINSGYRNNTVNGLVGGVKNSKHRDGLAVDIQASPALVEILENRDSHGKYTWYTKKNFIHIQLTN